MKDSSVLTLHPVDLVIMVIYLAVMIAVGFAFSKKTRTTEGYFLGDHSAPSWVLGLSMIAAKISSVTFLALPAAAFALDWRLFVPNLSIIPVAILAIWIFVPFFRRAAQTTAFEYLNARFGAGARLYGSIIFLLGQALRLGAVIYLVTIPIEMFTGLSPWIIMLIVGVFCTVYTIVGGLQAVIWTDAIQAIILYLGGLAALIVMVNGVPGGMAEIWRVANENDKFSFGPMRWDFSERTFYTMFVIGLLAWINQYTSDQVLIQRYLAAKDLRQARMAGWSSAFLCLPTWAFFFLLGTALFVFYKFVPDPAVASLPADSVFPHFILTRMPHGLSGLVIAGVLSAAMGSLSAALNAFGTVATVDIVRPYLIKGRSDRYYTVTAKMLTGLAAVVMLAIGLALSHASKESYLDLSQQIIGLIGGVVPCFFLLGFFASRVNRRIVWQAFAVASALNVYLLLVQFKVISPVFGWAVHPYWVSTLVAATMIAVAIVLSRIHPQSAGERSSLTIFASRESKDARPDPCRGE